LVGSAVLAALAALTALLATATGLLLLLAGLLLAATLLLLAGLLLAASLLLAGFLPALLLLLTGHLFFLIGILISHCSLLYHQPSLSTDVRAFRSMICKCAFMRIVEMKLEVTTVARNICRTIVICRRAKGFSPALHRREMVA
jgi:hypothetical protein